MIPKKDLNFFFILGAAKCGTTSLHFYLDQHPDILMSNPKETLFFEKEFINDVDFYIRKYFKKLGSQKYLGEARQRNLFLPYVPERVAKIFPNAKLIVAVRNPVERAFSHYLHRKSRKYEKLSFKKAIERDFAFLRQGKKIETGKEIERYLSQLAPDGASIKYRTYIECGHYAEQIERYLRFFQKEQLLIVFLEDIKRNPREVYANILRFIDEGLGLVDINFDARNIGRSRASTLLSNLVSKSSIIKRKTPERAKNFLYSITDLIFSNENQMDHETRRILVDHYWKHNRRLEKITGRDLSHWDK